jgi:hypothetical protein
MMFNIILLLIQNMLNCGNYKCINKDTNNYYDILKQNINNTNIHNETYYYFHKKLNYN